MHMLYCCIVYMVIFFKHSKHHCGFSGMGILFQAFIIYPTVMIRRTFQSEAGTWHWNECSALHISLSLFQMVHPGNNFALYFSGQYPHLTFHLCRIVEIVEWVVPVILLICSIFPDNNKKYKKIKILQMCLAFILMAMHTTFAIAYRLSNFVYSGTLSLCVYLPSYFWDEFFIVQWIKYVLDKTIFKVLSIMPDVLSNVFIQSRKILSVQRRQSAFHQLIGLFFFLYAIEENIGDFGLYRKPDRGDIGQLLALPQNWRMFIEMRNYTKFWFLAGRMETEFDHVSIDKLHDNNNRSNIRFNASRIIIQDLIVNNYQHAQIYDGEKRYLRGPNGRPFNPVSYSKNMRWERLFKRVKEKEDIKASILEYFCRKMRQHNKEIEVRRYSRSKDGSQDNITLSKMVNVKRFKSIEYCVFIAKIVHMTEQPGAQWGPSYSNQHIKCDEPFICPAHL